MKHNRHIPNQITALAWALTLSTAWSCSGSPGGGTTAINPTNPIAPATPKVASVTGKDDQSHVILRNVRHEQMNSEFVDADRLLSQGLKDEALQKFAGIYAKYHDQRAMKCVGDIYFEKGQKREALACYKTAAVDDPETLQGFLPDTKTWFRIAELGRELKDPASEAWGYQGTIKCEQDVMSKEDGDVPYLSVGPGTQGLRASALLAMARNAFRERLDASWFAIAVKFCDDAVALCPDWEDARYYDAFYRYEWGRHTDQRGEMYLGSIREFHRLYRQAKDPGIRSRAASSLSVAGEEIN